MKTRWLVCVKPFSFTYNNQKFNIRKGVVFELGITFNLAQGWLMRFMGHSVAYLPSSSLILKHCKAIENFEAIFLRYGLTLEDAKLYKLWVDTGTFKLSLPQQKICKALFTRIATHLPNTKPTKVLYRGLRLTPSFIDSILSGKATLKPQLLSSWTTSRSDASTYGNVVLRTTTANPILWIDKSFQRFVQNGDNSALAHANRNEVIVAGCGITGRLEKKHIVEYDK
jgi:hypothetical protein